MSSDVIEDPPLPAEIKNAHAALQKLLQTEPPAPSAELSVMRVNQVDALHLDNELSAILAYQFKRIFAHWNSTVFGNYDPEIGLFLRGIVFLCTTMINEPTPGQRLQNMRYRNESFFTSLGTLKPEHHKHAALAERLTLGQRLAFGACTVMGRYVWDKSMSFMIEWGWAAQHQEQGNTWKRRVYKLLRWLETTFRALSLINFVVFLCRGKYRTLIERMLRMRLVYIESRVLRQISFEFLNQQLLWQGMSEFMLFLLPLINFNWFMLVFRNMFSNPAHAREIRGCCICNSEDITMPTVAPCGHLYCYYCISARVKAHAEAELAGLDSKPYKCPLCEREVESYTPYIAN